LTLYSIFVLKVPFNTNQPTNQPIGINQQL